MQKPHDDSKACLTAFVQDSTLTVVIEMSLRSWLVAGMVPGVNREPRKKFCPPLIEILVDHDGAWRFNGCKISWIQSAATPSECVESSTARSRASRISAVSRCNGEQSVG